MNRPLSPSEWAEEFKAFASSEPMDPPRALSDGIASRVRSDLDPELGAVFAKLGGIHLAAGSVTLLFCPQFGVSPLGNSGLMPFLMRFGDQACMFGCGATFMALSALSAAVILRREEVRKLRKSELVWLPGLAALSAGLFFCMGGVLILGLAAFWLLGAVVGGLASLELGWLLKTRH
jgi:hypothetical protein